MTMTSRLPLAAVLLAALAARAHAQAAPDGAAGPAGGAPAAPGPAATPTEAVAPPGGAPTTPADTDTDTDDAQADGDKPKHKKQKHEPDGDRAADGAGDAAPDPDDDGGSSSNDWAKDIAVSGRVFFRATAYDEDANPWLSQLTLASARVGVRYHWKQRLEAKVSFEARGSVRDAYLDVRITDCLHLRAGRFKLPASAIERTSTWTLPTIERTLASEVLGGALGIVGRHHGAQLTWDPGRGIKPKLEVAVAQSFDDGGIELPRQLVCGSEDGDACQGGGGLMATARFEIEPVDEVHVGAFGQTREGGDYRTGIGRYWAAGIDVEAEAGGLRVWADAIAGSSHLGTVKASDDDTPFVAAQVIAGYRLGGDKRGKRFVEPYLAAAYINPIASFKGDLVTQVVGGVGAGRWKRWRGQLQAAYQSAQSQRPTSLGGVDVDFNDRLTLMAQLGAGF